MTDRYTGSQDYSLEEILADVRTSRQTPDEAEKKAPAAAADSAPGDSAPEELPEEEKPVTRKVPLWPEKEEKPAARKVPLWPEKEEQPARHPLAPEPDEEDDEFITAETLAGLEEEEEDERPRRAFSLFSRGKKEKSPKEKPAKPEKKRGRKPEPEPEEPYYGLRLKTREEYKRDYEQTMAFDSVAKGDGESPYSYLFHDEGETPDDGMDEQMRKMRQERAARVAKVMRQAGLDEEEDIFSLYQREEAQRLEKNSRDAKAAARVLEKAGGEPVPEEDEPVPPQESPAPRAAAPQRQAKPARPEPAHVSAAEPEPEEDAIPVPEAQDDPGDGVMRVNRPQKAEQPSFRAVPPPVFVEEEPEASEKRPAAKDKPAQGKPFRWDEPEAPAKQPAAKAEPVKEISREPAPLAEEEAAEDERVLPDETPRADAEPDGEKVVKEPEAPAPQPAPEPQRAPVREPAGKPQPRVLSGGAHEHAYRPRGSAPQRVVVMEETPQELSEALGNEARTYPRPSRLGSLRAADEASREKAEQAPARSVREELLAEEENEGRDIFSSSQPASAARREAGEEAAPERTARPRREPGSSPASGETEKPAAPRTMGKTIPLRPPVRGEEEKEEKEDEPVRRKPAKRRRRFSILGTQEKDNRPEDEFPADPGELDDYEKPDDAASIFHDLAEKRRTLLLRAGVTGLSLVLMLLFGLLSEYSGILPAFLPYYLLTQPYLILEFIFLLVSCAFSWPVLWNGLKGLVKLKANSDSGVAIAAAAGVIHTALLLFFTGSVESASLHLYAPLVSLALLLNTLGKLSMVNRVTKNFRFVASPDRKCAVHLFDDHNTALQMARGAVADAPSIAYQARTGFLKDFLRLSYLPDPCEQNASVLAPIGFVSSLLLFAAALLLSHDAMAALTAFTASCCVWTPMMGQLCVNLPLAQASRTASRYGAMISGYRALDRFSDVNAVLLDAKELFPKNCVVLSGIKTFGDQHIDDAILDAAALLNEMGGTLSEIFDQVIQSRRELLPKVESASYEDGKGIAGWVSGHRVLVGTRELLAAHDITPPSRDYEKKYSLGGKKLLYLASGGQLVAMFLIAYNADRRRTVELCRLEDNGVAFLVRTCDPNITPRLIADAFQLDEGSVNVLPKRLGDVYGKVTKETKTAPAFLATKGRPTSLMRLLAICIRQRGNISIAVALQNVAAALGFILVAFLSCYSGQAKLTTMFLLLYEAFWAAAIVVIPKLKKP